MALPGNTWHHLGSPGTTWQCPLANSNDIWGLTSFQSDLKGSSMEKLEWWRTHRHTQSISTYRLDPSVGLAEWKLQEFMYELGVGGYVAGQWGKFLPPTLVCTVYMYVYMYITCIVYFQGAYTSIHQVFLFVHFPVLLPCIHSKSGIKICNKFSAKVRKSSKFQKKCVKGAFF